LFCLFVCTACFVHASPNGWLYKRAINIQAVGTALEEYQVLVALKQGEFNYAHANVDGSDIRFSTDSTGSREPDLNHWTEFFNQNGESRIWVNVPTIPASGSVTIYMYYGNPLADDRSNGPATFDLYDDFEGETLDMNTWIITQNQGAITIENGLLKLFRPGAAVGSRIDLFSKTEFEGSKVIDVHMLLSPEDHYYTNLYYGKCGLESCTFSSLGYVVFSGYESALYTGNYKFPPRTTSRSFQDGDVIRNPKTLQWFSDQFIVRDGGVLSRNENGELFEESESYQGVSGGNIGFFVSSPDTFFMRDAETWIDYIRVRKYSPIEPEVDVQAEETPTFSLPVEPDLPFAEDANGYVLSPPFPNPLSYETEFYLTVDITQHVRIRVYNISGQQVADLKEGILASGVKHAFRFESGRLPDGVYFIRVNGEYFNATRRLVLVK